MKRIVKKVGAVVMSLAVAVSGITIGETKTKSVKAAVKKLFQLKKMN